MSDVELGWLDPVAPPAPDQVHRVVAAVLELGGAVGWVSVPDRAESDRWLAERVGEVAAGRSRVALVSAGGRLAGVGRWSWYASPAVAVNADIRQVMVHPEARGQGLARALVAALVDDAREHRVETLTLDVRGNNHAAMALYETFGFQVVGRLPDFVAVGAERWDRVLYRLDLRSADAPVRRHGARPVGPGASLLPAASGRPAFPPRPLAGPAGPA
ncbi:MAG: GNAT family N-acetyltransferase [Mycobacteriales bacterium]